jgi:hypothetical protein
VYDSNDRHLACRLGTAGRLGVRALTVAATRCRIVLRARLSERFESAFDGMILEHAPNQTVLVGDVRDQAHLYRLIDQALDFGIELLVVEQTEISGGSEASGSQADRPY